MTARAILLLILTGMSPALMSPASASERQYTRACAERDLKIVTLIEASGETGGIPAVLAKAGLTQMQARLNCLSGHEREALALYDEILHDLSRSFD